MDEGLRYAVVCSSNQNRSMEAHKVLAKKGFNVRSFGTGSQVKLPGPAADRPNVFDFGTPYTLMYKMLEEQDRNLYTQNGILNMLERNIRIKESPERFQDCHDKFDVIFSCEERVYDQIMEELSKREPVDYSTVHVINYDIPDNHEDAFFGATSLCKMAEMISMSSDLDNDMDELLQEFESLVENPIIHSVAFQ